MKVGLVALDEEDETVVDGDAVGNREDEAGL